MIEWEEEQAGFIIYSVEVRDIIDSNTIDELYKSSRIMCCDFFKCLVPGSEILEYLNSIKNYSEYESLIYKILIYDYEDLLLDLGLQII